MNLPTQRTVIGGQISLLITALLLSACNKAPEGGAPQGMPACHRLKWRLSPFNRKLRLYILNMQRKWQVRARLRFVRG